MMRKYLCVLFVTVTSVVFSPIAVQADATAKITVKVVNEEGQPVENAKVVMCFF